MLMVVDAAMKEAEPLFFHKTPQIFGVFLPPFANYVVSPSSLTPLAVVLRHASPPPLPPILAKQ